MRLRIQYASSSIHSFLKKSKCYYLNMANHSDLDMCILKLRIYFGCIDTSLFQYSTKYKFFKSVVQNYHAFTKDDVMRLYNVIND